jgi:hypothetical protein
MATQAQLDQEALIKRQDELRPYRQFMSLVSGISGEQTYSGADGVGYNPTGQFVSTGPYSQAVEGQPIVTYSPSSGVSIAPVVLLIGLGVVAFLAMK